MCLSELIYIYEMFIFIVVQTMDYVRCAVRAVPNWCWRHETLYYWTESHYVELLTFWLKNDLTSASFWMLLFTCITFVQFLFAFVITVCKFFVCSFSICFVFVRFVFLFPLEECWVANCWIIISVKSICVESIANGAEKLFRWRDVSPFLRWNRSIFSRLLRIHVKERSLFSEKFTSAISK